jgi:hypothetical protein
VLALLGGVNAIVVLQIRRRFSGFAIATWAALYFAFRHLRLGDGIDSEAVMGRTLDR